MMPFGDLYSKCYDLLYLDKDYSQEVSYIVDLIKTNHPEAQTILDLGCGSGRHDLLFAKENFNVFGVDMSKDMIAIAKQSVGDLDEKLTYHVGDIRDFETDQKFDVVVSLFHVFSYMTTNEELEKALQTAYKHLKKDGILIFDYWYGPAVLTERPSIKVRRKENDAISLTRISEPEINTENNYVDVHFSMFVNQNQGTQKEEFFETHRMRYYFLPELKLFAKHNGFKLLDSFEFLKKNEPTMNSWNAISIARKTSYEG